MDKGKSKIKKTQRSPKKMDSKSPRERKKKITITSRKETYGEERKIKNNKGVFLPQNTTYLHLLIRLCDLFLLRSGF
jgi:hypothetical protein